MLYNVGGEGMLVTVHCKICIFVEIEGRKKTFILMNIQNRKQCNFTISDYRKFWSL